MPKSSRSSFPVSTVEWIASLYMAALPVTSAAPNLQIAIATLPAIAAMMTRSEPECSATIPPPLRRRYGVDAGLIVCRLSAGGRDSDLYVAFPCQVVVFGLLPVPSSSAILIMAAGDLGVGPPMSIAAVAARRIYRLQLL